MASCIIPDSEYAPPLQTPVFVVQSSITPSPQSTLALTQDPPVTIHLAMTVYAEDAGDELISALYFDYKHENGYFVLPHRHGIGTISMPRSVVYDVSSARFEAGCHTLTIMVLHESHWDDANSEVIGTPSDLASVNWFVNFENGTATLLNSCPDATTEVPGIGR